MKKLSHNLKNLLNTARLSENELARRTGVPQQVINRILSGENKNPKIGTLLPISNYFMVSISQLIGDEPMAKEIKLNTAHLGWNEIPLLEWGMIDKCNIGNISSENNKRILVDLEVGANCFAVTLIDNSMEPKFPEGTILIFDKEKKMTHASFGLFYIHKNKQIVFRQVFFKGKNRYLKCLNPNLTSYQPILLNSDDKYLSRLIQSKLNH